MRRSVLTPGRPGTATLTRDTVTTTVSNQFQPDEMKGFQWWPQ